MALPTVNNRRRFHSMRSSAASHFKTKSAFTTDSENNQALETPFERAKNILCRFQSTKHLLKSHFYAIIELMKRRDPVKNLWKGLANTFPASEEEAQLALDLFKDYESRKGWHQSGSGVFHQSAELLLQLSLPVVCDFFRRAAALHSAESPVKRRRDSRWMSELDYTRFNIRAASAQPGFPGNFINASMMLSALNTKGLLLEPMTLGPSENLWVIHSHAELRPDLVHAEVAAKGFDARLQLMAFCEAAHLLGFTLGLQLDHQVEFSAVVVRNRPELFYWMRGGGLNTDADFQASLVASLRKAMARSEPVDSSFLSELDRYFRILNQLDVSPFLSDTSLGLTPMAFRQYRDAEFVAYEKETIEYLGRVFAYWRDIFGFDFLVIRSGGGFAAALRAVPESDGSSVLPVPPWHALDENIIRMLAGAARGHGVRNNIGVMADADTFDVEKLGMQGVDLVMEENAHTVMSSFWMRRSFELEEKLTKINSGRKLKFSVPVSIDPGQQDSALGRRRSMLKRFVARFLGAGSSRRPLLETMASLECAWGYDVALEQSVAMNWFSDKDNARICANIEETAIIYKDIINSGKRCGGQGGERQAWWVMKSSRGMLFAVVSLENKEALPPESLKIDYSAYLDSSISRTLMEHDFNHNRGSLILNTGTVIEVRNIPYGGFRLYVII